MKIHKVAYGVYHPNFENHLYRNLTISQTHTEPFNRGHDDDSVQHGILTVDGLTFEGCRFEPRCDRAFGACAGTKPSLIALLDDHEALRTLPAGSLAHAYCDFMESEGLTAKGLVDEFDTFRDKRPRIDDRAGIQPSFHVEGHDYARQKRQSEF